MTAKRTGPPSSAPGGPCIIGGSTTVVWFRHLRAASSVARCGLSGASFAVPCDSCGVSDAARCGLFVASSAVPCDLYDVPDGAPCRSSRRTVLERVMVLERVTAPGPQHARALAPLLVVRSPMRPLNQGRKILADARSSHFFLLISQTPYSNVMTPNPFEARVSERPLNKVRQSHTQMRREGSQQV